MKSRFEHIIEHEEIGIEGLEEPIISLIKEETKDIEISVSGGGGSSSSGGATISDGVYGAAWDADTTGGASRHAIFTKIETLGGGHDPVTLDVNAEKLLSLSTQEVGLDTQTANKIFAGPATGAVAAPTFRDMVAADVPDLSGTYLTVESDPVYLASQAANIDAGDITNLGNLSGTNTGDQTTIVGITGTMAEFDAAVTDGNIAYVGGAFHDGFSDFVANEHIDHTAVTLTAGDGLTGGGDISANRTFAVGVDDATIEIDTDKLRVKADGINDTHIDWGTGATQVSAVDVPIADAGTYFDTDDVETALQDLALPPTKTIKISPGYTDNDATLKYSTIQAALTANTAGGELFVVYPGTYAGDTINFTANNQWVVGAQNPKPASALVTNNATICDYTDKTGCLVKDIKMQMTLAANGADSTIDGNAGGSCNFKHCHIECIASGTIDGTVPGGSTCARGDGTVKIVDSSVVYTNTADRGARGKKAMLIETGSVWILDTVALTSTGSGTGINHAGIRDNSDGDLLIINSTVNVTDNDATVTYCLNIDNGSGSPEVYRNQMECTNTGADHNSITIRIGSSTTLSVRSTYNHFHSTAGGGGTAKAYYLQIDDANTTAISQFDDLVAADGKNIVAGTFTRVNSSVDGELTISGCLYQGLTKQYSQCYDGTDQQFALTSGDFYFNSDVHANITGDITGNADTVTNGVYTTDFPLNQDTTGLAATATALATARTIGGTSFDGTANIKIGALSSTNIDATTSAELAGVISDETGSGKLVFETSPTLVTPALGAATYTTLGGGAITTTDDVIVNADNKGLVLGAGQDSDLFFNGTDTFFNTTGTFQVNNSDPNPCIFVGENDAGNIGVQFKNNSDANTANTATVSVYCKTSVGSKAAGALRAGFTDITDATRDSFLTLISYVDGSAIDGLKVESDGDITLHNQINQQAWQDASFSNSWVNYGGVHATAQYYLDTQGTVHLKGLVKDGTLPATMFTLPVGYRPAAKELFGIISTGAFGRVSIDTDGTVDIDTGTNTNVSLAGITFRAA